jgi:hypothetical protein
MPSFGGLFAVTELRSHKDYENAKNKGATLLHLVLRI